LVSFNSAPRSSASDTRTWVLKCALSVCGLACVGSAPQSKGRGSRPYSCPYSPKCVEGVFCEVELPLYGVLGSSPNRLCEVRAIRLDSQRVLRIGRHSVPFRGSAIVPTISSFLSRAPEKVPTPYITRTSIKWTVSWLSAALGEDMRR